MTSRQRRPERPPGWPQQATATTTDQSGTDTPTTSTAAATPTLPGTAATPPAPTDTTATETATTTAAIGATTGADVAEARFRRRWRVLVAKVGLDGHDRGVKVVGRVLRDAGFEVIYTGLQQTPEMVVAAARDEDVDLIGLSLLSGAHMTLVPRLLDELHRQGLDTPLVVGGIIPAADGAALQELGVSAVLTPGASTLEIIDAVTRAIEEYGLGQDQASSTGR